MTKKELEAALKVALAERDGEITARENAERELHGLLREFRKARGEDSEEEYDLRKEIARSAHEFYDLRGSSDNSWSMRIHFPWADSAESRLMIAIDHLFNKDKCWTLPAEGTELIISRVARWVLDKYETHDAHGNPLNRVESAKLTADAMQRDLRNRRGR